MLLCGCADRSVAPASEPSETELSPPSASLSERVVASPAADQAATPTASTTASETPQRPAVKTVNAASYDGKWEVRMDPGGCGTCRLALEIHTDASRRASVTVLQESDHAVHVADIEFAAELDESGTGNFVFDEDGWFHKGRGTIALKPNAIEVTIAEVEDNADAEGDSSYSIFQGTERFYRLNPILQGIAKTLIQKTGIKGWTYKGDAPDRRWMYCAAPSADGGEGLCYVVDRYSGKYYEGVSGEYEGNLYRDLPVHAAEEVAAFVRKQLNLPGDVSDDGYSEGNYLVRAGDREYAYDSESGDLFDGDTGEFARHLGTLEAPDKTGDKEVQ